MATIVITSPSLANTPLRCSSCNIGIIPSNYHIIIFTSARSGLLQATNPLPYTYVSTLQQTVYATELAFAEL